MRTLISEVIGNEFVYFYLKKKNAPEKNSFYLYHKRTMSRKLDEYYLETGTKSGSENSHEQ